MNELLALVRDVFNVDSVELTDELAFADLETWDSLTHMVFITRLESAFAIELSGDEIADMRTISDLKTIVARHADPGS